MDTADLIWQNGEFVPWEDAKVHVLTHGLHYGTGVFEGIRCYETERGPAIFRHGDHLTRLEKSAELYYLPLPYSAAELAEATRELIRRNGLASCYIRPLAFRGYGSLGLFATDAPVDVIIATFPWGVYLGEDGKRDGIRAGISSWRSISGESLIPHAKAAGQYLNSILAKTERDAEMCALSARFPQYGFDRHKGYATSEHLDALGRLGPCEIHRRSFHAVGVFFQKDLFSDGWGAMAETLRVRSYRMYCDARKLAVGPGLTLLGLRAGERRLRRTYADVLASAEAAPQVDLVERVLSEAKAQLRPVTRPRRRASLAARLRARGGRRSPSSAPRSSRGPPSPGSGRCGRRSLRRRASRR